MKSKIVALFVCAISLNAFGWGAEGHRITGLMAAEMLTPKARIAVNQLLDGGSLADAAIYLDVYREALKREKPGSERWHYDNIPVCADFVAETYCSDGNCASVQIPLQFAILADKTRTKEDRQHALRALVHLVGDIHQPLHASDDNDLGGGRKVVFMPNGDVQRNLHIVWDVDMVKLVVRGSSESDFAKKLFTDYRREFAGWMRASPVAWIVDSHGIAKRLAYGKLPGFTCGEIDGKKVGRYEGKVWGDTAVMLTEEYVKGATGIIPILLARSGARIGGLLNAALDPEGATANRPSARTAPAASEKTTPPATPTLPKTESLLEALSRPAPATNNK